MPRSRSSRPLFCPSASHQTPPLPKETRRALPSASVAVARSHPSAPGWSSLIVPAVRIYSSHALGHRATPHSWPRLRLETPLPYGSRVWRRLPSNRPSILGQFDARPPPLHQAKLGTGRRKALNGVNMLTKVNDLESRRVSCRVASSRSHGRILARPLVPSLSRCIQSDLSEPVVFYSFKSAPLLFFPSPSPFFYLHWADL